MVNALVKLWSSVKSNPLFVTIYSAVGGAILDLIQDYVMTNTIDLSEKGLKKMGFYIVGVVAASILHLYRPSPTQKETK